MRKVKLLLINPPNSLRDKTYLAPPLGLLTIASFVGQFGYETEVIDLNLELLANNLLDNDCFYTNTINRITERNPDIVGFTSMCLESHVSLEIAKRLKEISPDIVTIFGGTHFGAIAREVLLQYPFADYVIKGEGEYAIISILNYLSGISDSFSQNVFYRQNNHVLSGDLNPQIFKMEEIPFPAYHLVNLKRYFELNPAHLFNYEAGRGCVFKCEFCYSPFHYEDSARNKSSETVVNELKTLLSLGAKHIFFVQDNFLNSPRWALEVCRKIADANLPLTWECYTTYPQLKENIIDALSDAGCIGVFTGIDAVAPSSQKRMNKPFLRNWDSTKKKLEYCLKKHIKPICAFLLEEPDQDKEKVESTVFTALECIKLGCEVHINTLSLYNQTGLARKLSGLTYSYSPIKTELLLDTPKILQKNKFAEQNPELFPYHSTYCDINSWEIFTAQAYTMLAVIVALTNSVHQYMVIDKKPIWKMMKFIDSKFVDWLKNLPSQERNEAVVFEFAKKFAELKLSHQVRYLLHVELARLLLSKRKERRFINLFIKQESISAELSWFVSLQKIKLPSFFTDEKIVKIRFNLLNGETPIAVLSKDGIIRLRSVNTDLRALLKRFEHLSLSNKNANLSQTEKVVLERDGWISITRKFFKDDILV